LTPCINKKSFDRVPDADDASRKAKRTVSRSGTNAESQSTRNGFASAPSYAEHLEVSYCAATGGA
jgi:hypothetical protein